MGKHYRKRTFDDRAMGEGILSLFGKVSNVAIQLGLQHIPYGHLRIALSGGPIAEHFVDQIEERWIMWKRVHLRIGVPRLDWPLPQGERVHEDDQFNEDTGHLERLIDERDDEEIEYWRNRFGAKRK